MNEKIVSSKKPKLSIINKACFEISGFEKIKNDFYRKLIINGYSPGTYQNYMRQIAHLSLKTGKLPEDSTEQEIEEYLLYLKINKYSYDNYKHTVWGLYLFFRFFSESTRSFKVPRIPAKLSLPIVLSKSECKKLFNSAKSLKNRVLLYLIYSGGLRLSETCNLKWAEIDFSRRKILIKAGKNRKDRYVMLSVYLRKWLIEYRKEYKSVDYVFNGRVEGKPFCSGTIRQIVKEIARKSGIKKNVSCHTLRHSFATHLLEDGVDLVTIKELIGHSRIQHTLIYTHIAQVKITKAKSPLDTLYLKSRHKKVNLNN
jgi:integrase/recombinase XerD